MRPQTTVPQQALFGMNSPFVTEQAQRLAARPEVANQSDAAGKIRALYRLIYSRAPEPDELAAGERFLAESQAFLASGPGGIWQYGAGAYDETAKRVTSFTPLPHFEGKSWRGGPALPDRQFGWVLLTAEGGHPGNDLAHAAVRRFTAPRDGTLKAFATLAHPAEQGDGVRGRIVSSRLGELGRWTVHHGKVDTKVEGVEVKQGDTIDFVVDCLGSEANDSFTWPPIVSLAPVAGSGGRVQQWVAPADFKGPQPAAMSPLEQYAQALLLANEFVFVD
jgi:hypothetical protein